MGTITGIDAYANVWVDAPDDGDPATAENIRMVAEHALNNTRHLYDHGVLDDDARPGGNSGTFLMAGDFGGEDCDISCGELVVLESLVVTTPKIEIDSAAGTIVLQDTDGQPAILMHGPNAAMSFTDAAGATMVAVSGPDGLIITQSLQAALQPAKDADPGANNLVTGPNICKAWALVRFDNSVVTIHDGYNIDDIVINAISTQADVTFVRAMANATFAVTTGVDEPLDTTIKVGNKATTGFSMVMSEAGATLDLDNDIVVVQFAVFGRQS